MNHRKINNLGCISIRLVPFTSVGSILVIDKWLRKRSNRFMKPANKYINELSRIINGALRLDIDKVRNYTAYLAEKLESGGDPGSADRLRKLLTETDGQLRPVDVEFKRSIPVDAETRFPLVDRQELNANFEPPVVLSQIQQDVVNEFLSVARSYALLEASGVGDGLALIMYGPPGTGKSRLARHIASELDLDLYVARLDGLISSYLGSTSKNIRALFDFAAKTPCVLFLDEFDAIAKLRGDSHELGELKRVVNSFIQNLDALHGHSVVLAATNHEELLDSAIWRRFGYRIEFSYPDRELRAVLWEQFLPPSQFDSVAVELLVDLSDGFSGSDIHEICRRLYRRQITAGESPKLSDAFAVLRNVAIGEGSTRRFVSTLQDKSEKTVIEALRLRNKKLYSYSSIGRLLEISKATVQRRVAGR